MHLGLVTPAAFLHLTGDPGKNGEAHRKESTSFIFQPLERLGEPKHQQDLGHMPLDGIKGICGRPGEVWKGQGHEHSRHLRCGGRGEPARKGGVLSPLNSHTTWITVPS